MKQRNAIPWLVTVLALVLAASSTAVAAPTLASAITKKQATKIAKKIAKKEANKAIDARVGSLSVAQAANATHATNATHAGSADQATIALSPVAYAVVNQDGTIVAGSTRGLTQANVTQRDLAAYCFDTPFAFKTVQTTPVHTGVAAPVEVKVGIRDAFGVVAECQAHEEVEVATSVSGAFAKTPFIIWFYN